MGWEVIRGVGVIKVLFLKKKAGGGEVWFIGLMKKGEAGMQGGELAEHLLGGIKSLAISQGGLWGQRTEACKCNSLGAN